MEPAFFNFYWQEEASLRRFFCTCIRDLVALRFYGIVFPFLTHFVSLVSFSTLLKRENLWFSDVFSRYKKRPVAWNGLSCQVWTPFLLDGGGIGLNLLPSFQKESLIEGGFRGGCSERKLKKFINKMFFCHN